ncbi:MAG TPA: MarR family transcriptional regulator, partial [Chthoniobacteraceae bacterium]
PHESDRRAHRVTVRPEGREIFNKAREIALELQNQVLASLPEERRLGFLADLETVGNACAVILEKIGD